MRKGKLLLGLLFLVFIRVNAQTEKVSDTASLYNLQQGFVNLRFGMFIHFNIPTFMNQDWADPDASPALFNPKN